MLGVRISIREISSVHIPAIIVLRPHVRMVLCRFSVEHAKEFEPDI